MGGHTCHLTGHARHVCVRAQDSDLWAIYARGCLGQLLEMNRNAALVNDPDIESLVKDHVQPARPAPRAPRRR